MPNLAVENQQLLNDLITRHDLVVAKDIILANAVECAALFLGEVETYKNVGNSRYGGVPDLPPSLNWVKSDEGYLSFLMQINLAELPNIEQNPLPDKGILYFFIEEDEACTEVIAKVLFYGGDLSSLSRAIPPSIESFAPVARERYTDLTPHIIYPRLAIDLPNYGSIIFDRIDELAETTDAGDGSDRYFNLIDEAIGESNDVPIVGKLLGFASELNYNMLENAHLFSIGDRNKINDYQHRQDCQEELAQAAAKWRLLWRIDSNFSVGVCIWDAGSFFTMIRHEDLEQHNFENVYIEIETG